MKRIICILLVLVMALGITACKKAETYSQMDYMEEDLTAYVTLGQYKGLTLSGSPIAVSDDTVEAQIQELIAAYSSYEEYETEITDRATEKGDYLLVDYAGYMDGEQFEGGTAEGAYVLLMEDNGYIDWFEDDLYGVMPGAVVETTDFFPDNYREGFSGKEVTFVITVRAIAGHYTVPELTDAFVKEKTGCETVEEYRTLIYDTLLEEATQTEKMERYQVMWEAILANATYVSIPEEQVMFYYTSDRSYYESVAAEYGYTYDEYLAACGVDDAYIKSMAEQVVREELVFYSIIKAENIVLTEEDYLEGVAEYAVLNDTTVEELEEAYGREYIESNLLWDKLIYTLYDVTSFVTE